MIIFALCGREYVCREGTGKLQKEEGLKGRRAREKPLLVGIMEIFLSKSCH